ncbi:phosphoglycerate mutase family protein [Algimonas arctica]|nr:phosphoglycerate mutase family protein [Algimonas arctica]
MRLNLKQGFTQFFASIAMVGLAACASAPEPTDVIVTQTHAPATIFLVRHAEKLTEDDPDLTPEGHTRADVLADLLIDAEIERIHSSDYARTRQTAGPLAEQLGLEVELYDPRDLPAMAAQLKADGGRHLVVGHSNTTGELAEALGGDGGTPIVEATEYDRLYVVTMGADGKTVSTLLRFGATAESYSDTP